jgi:hypothetical protein
MAESNKSGFLAALGKRISGNSLGNTHMSDLELSNFEVSLRQAQLAEIVQEKINETSHETRKQNIIFRDNEESNVSNSIGSKTDEALVDTLNDVLSNVQNLTDKEMKIQMKRLEAIQKSLDNLDELQHVSERKFLQEEYAKTLDFLKGEHKKRSKIMTKAFNTAANLASDFLDIRSLYAGFVDNNPLAMAAYKLVSTGISSAMDARKKKRELMAADEARVKMADREQELDVQRNKKEAEREEELSLLRRQVAEQESETSESNFERVSSDDTDNNISNFERVSSDNSENDISAESEQRLMMEDRQKDLEKRNQLEESAENDVKWNTLFGKLDELIEAVSGKSSSKSNDGGSNSGGFLDSVMDFLGIKAMLGASGSSKGGGIKAAASKFKGKLSSGFKSMLSPVKGLSGLATGVMGKVSSSVGSNKYISKISEKAASVKGSVASKLDQVKSFGSDKLGAAKGTIMRLPGAEKVAGVASSVGSGLSKAGGVVVDIGSKAGSGLAKAGGFLGDIGSKAGSGISKAVGFVGDMGSKAGSGISKAGGFLGDIGSKAGSGLAKAGGFVANIGSKAILPLSGLLAAGTEYAQSGSIGRAAGSGVGAMGGSLAGMAAGAAMGSVVPVVGTIIGGAIGGILGGMAGESLGKDAGGAIESLVSNSDDQTNKLEAAVNTESKRADILEKEVAISKENERNDNKPVIIPPADLSRPVVKQRTANKTGSNLMPMISARNLDSTITRLTDRYITFSMA